MRKAASHSPRLFKRILTSLFLISFFVFSIRIVNAWSTGQTAEAVCDSSTGKVMIKTSFTNSEKKGSDLSMIVIARDEQTGTLVNVGEVKPGETVESGWFVDRDNVNDGKVKFELKWKSKTGSDVRYAEYSAVECRVEASASPSPSASATVTASPSVAATNPPQSNTRTDLSDNRSDGRKDSLDCVPESQNGRKDCNTQKGVVLGVSTLPTTGLFEEHITIYLILSLIAFTAGFLVIGLAKAEERELK